MRSSDKKPKANNRQVSSARSKDAVAKDKSGDSAQLRQIAKMMGNDHVRKTIQDGSSQRDALLSHICARLGVLQGAQKKEQLSMSREREWFKGVAKGADGYHLPDLTRWHESAKLYKKAGQALCSGQLGRGAQLIQQASAAEAAAFDSVPKFVKTDLDANEQAESAPETAQQLNDEAVCSGCAKPANLKIADLILAHQDKMEKTPPLPRRKPAWFDEEKEEEEEQSDES